MKIERSIETTAPPERVWPLLVTPEEILKWFMLLESFEYTSGQRGAGTTFTKPLPSVQRSRRMRINAVMGNQCVMGDFSHLRTQLDVRPKKRPKTAISFAKCQNRPASGLLSRPQANKLKAHMTVMTVIASTTVIKDGDTGSISCCLSSAFAWESS